MKKIFITTTLPYANSTPHMGHCFELVVGDFISRLLGKIYGGENVLFNTGLDEHGLKIFKAAEKENSSVHEFLEILKGKWENFCVEFGIAYDIFYRTSAKAHGNRVQEIWKNLTNAGYIHKKHYTGKYCIGCESFKTDRELIAGKCPDHPLTKIEEVNEENYFLKISAFRETLKAWRKQQPNFLIPYRKNLELDNILNAIDDISISRNKEAVQWGVPVPGDDSQVIYVWFDALLNYIFAAGYMTDEDMFKDFWNDIVIQICGSDNLKFQGVIHQAILSAMDLKHPTHLIVHGTILDAEGRKMSKSTGNVVSPEDQLQKYGADAVRYYLLAGIRQFEDSKWDEKHLVELYNSHLGNELGNLFARVLHLIDTKSIEIDHSLVQHDKVCAVFDLSLDDQKKEFASSLNWKVYCDSLNQKVKWANAYLNEEAPWKNPPNATLNELHYVLSRLADAYEPIIPGAAKKMKYALNLNKKVILFPKI